MIRLTCPTCTNLMEIDTLSGDTTCPHCNTQIEIPSASITTAATSHTSPSTSNMSLTTSIKTDRPFPNVNEGCQEGRDASDSQAHDNAPEAVYTLTLTQMERKTLQEWPAELNIFDYILGSSHRYKLFALLSKQCRAIPSDAGWFDAQDITFVIPDHVAWTMGDIIDAGPPLFTKLHTFRAGIGAPPSIRKRPRPSGEWKQWTLRDLTLAGWLLLIPTVAIVGVVALLIAKAFPQARGGWAAAFLCVPAVSCAMVFFCIAKIVLEGVGLPIVRRDSDVREPETNVNTAGNQPRKRLGCAVGAVVAVLLCMVGAVVLWKTGTIPAWMVAAPAPKFNKLPLVAGKAKPEPFPKWDVEPDWKQLDLQPNNAGVQDMGEFLRLRPEQRIETKKPYDGPIEITVLARTERNNIRLAAFAGGLVIFNWEVNPHELRIHRPDGNDKSEGCTLGTAPFTPLAPNAWHMLKWRIEPNAMTVTANNKTVYSERHNYNLKPKRPIGVVSADSTIDVRMFKVHRLDKFGQPAEK